VSILEVYNETINDLLVPGGGDDKLEVRQGEFGNYVPGLTTVPVSSLEEVSNLLSVADRNRYVYCRRATSNRTDMLK
jgi:kinesin family protein C2/C3